jgi:hypothetical protein
VEALVVEAAEALVVEVTETLVAVEASVAVEVVPCNGVEASETALTKRRALHSQKFCF